MVNRFEEERAAACATFLIGLAVTLPVVPREKTLVVSLLVDLCACVYALILLQQSMP